MKGIAIPMDLAELLGGGSRPQREEGGSGYDTTLSHDVQLERIKETFASYRQSLAGSQFKVGDIVHPLPQYGTKGRGQPHIVLEVMPPEQVKPSFGNGNPSSLHYGVRQDMRVACMIDNDTVAAFWVEGYQYEPFEA